MKNLTHFSTSFFTKKNELAILLFVLIFSINSFAKNCNNYFGNNFIDGKIYNQDILQNSIFNIKNPHTFQLFSHGRPGELLLNGKWCNAQEIANFLQPKIQNSKFKIDNLNIYGCEFAKGEKGLQAVKYLENKLNISVSASTNITGKDGDWVLEVGKTKDVIAVNNYNGNLQSCTYGTVFDPMYASNSVGATSWGGVSPGGATGSPNATFTNVYSTGTTYQSIVRYPKTFVAGSQVVLNAQWYSASFTDGALISFSNDSTTWTANSTLINGFNATSFSNSSAYTIPTGLTPAGPYKYIRIQGNSTSTLLNLNAVEVDTLRCANPPISGVSYNDNGSGGGTSSNCIKDGTENGSLYSTGMYAKLKTVAGVSAISATALSADGTFTITDVANGTYVVYLDNNNDLTDLTSSLPFSWSGTSTQTVTVTGGVVTPAINFCLTTTCLNGALNSNQYATASYGGNSAWGGIASGAIGAPNGTFSTVYSTTSTSDVILKYANPLLSGDTLKITAKWQSGYTDSIAMAFSIDSITWTSFTPYINGFNATSFTTVNYPLPSSGVGAKYIRIAGKSGSTATHIDAVQVGQMRCLNYPVSGVAYNDNGAGGGTATNCIKDGTESGSTLPSGVFAKIKTATGANAISAAALATDGTFTLTDVANGTYLVYLDNNNSLFDITPANPLNYRGTTSQTVTINNGVATPTLNFCLKFLDSDGDGIGDDTDLDDDNDGILDVNEMTPPCSSLYSSSDEIVGAFNNGDFTAGATGFSSDIDNPLITGAYATYNGVNGFTATWNPYPPNGSRVDPTNNYISTNDIAEQLNRPALIYSNTINGLVPNKVYYFEMDFTTSGTYLNFLVNGSSITGGTVLFNSSTGYNNFVWKKYAAPFTASSTGSITFQVIQDFTLGAGAGDAGFDNFKLFNPCISNADKDTDGDGIPDRLDLDSDGDGCPDAKEGGSALNPTITSNMPGGNSGTGYNGTSTSPVVLNLCNSAACVSTATATIGVPTVAIMPAISTNGQSVGYSESKTLNACLDSDGDGIPDLVDLDDDNDGILDAVESPSCYYTAAEMSIPATVTTEIPTTGTVTNLNDNSSTTTFAYTTTTAAAALNKSIVEITPAYPQAATSIVLNLNTATSPIGTLSSPTAIVKAQGWNGTTWVDLSTYTVLPTVTANVQTFTFANTTNYTKYRLLDAGTTGVSIGTDVMQDVSLGLPATYIPSANPKLVCNSDLDGDGIPNQLDLDSDGDGCPDAKEGGTNSLTATNPSGMPGGNSGSGYTGTISTPVTVNITTTAVGTTAGSNTYGVPTAAGTGQSIGYSQSKTLNFCADTDGDGIPDLVDLDDDNDGILDAVESPSCYYTLAEAKQFTLTSDLTIFSTYSLAKAMDGDFTTYNSFTSGQNIAGKVVYQLQFAAPVVLSSILDSLVNTTHVFTSGSTYKLQSSLDGITWTDASVLQTAGASATTNNVIITSNTSTSSAYYRIWGVSGTTQSNAYAEEIIPKIINYIPSANPKPICNSDLDGDGIPNQLDLDSDGDGCPDAKEGKNTLNPSNSSSMAGGNSGSGFSGVSPNPGQVTSNLPLPVGTIVGSNTIGVPTVAGTGQLVGLSQDKTFNNCTDSDGDGIPDLYDLDDDNDGILDVNEQCVPNPILPGWSNPMPTTESPAFTIKTYDGLNEALPNWGKGTPKATATYDGYPGFAKMNLNITGNSANTHIANTPGFSTPVGSDATCSFAIEYNMVISKPGYYSVYVKDIADAVMVERGSSAGTATTLFALPLAYNVYPQNGTGNYIVKNEYFNVGDTLKTTVMEECGVPNSTWFNAEIQYTPLCYLDTDGDGITNDKDLDSDGDGCPDAKEGGSVLSAANPSGMPGGNSGSGFTGVTPNPGPVSVNITTTAVGTTSGSNTYGVPTAAGTGQSVGNSTIKASNLCLDSDGDGIPNITDLDDDNDGILDAVESPSCFYTSSEAAVIQSVSTPLTNDDGTNIDLPFMHDGVTTNVTASNNIISDGAALNGKVVYNVKYVAPVQLTSLTVNGSGTWGASATAQLEASLDGITWVSLMSAPTAATATNNTFTVNQNAGLYPYYRVKKTAGTVGTGLSSPTFTTYEVSGVANSLSYIPSANPKPTCTSDLDGDGIPNYLDLDSDGDGCPDAKEGGSALAASNPSGMPGGNSGTGYIGTTSTPVTVNITTSAVGSTATTMGVPTVAIPPAIATIGQSIGYSQDKTQNACLDTDGDGIPDVFDLDDDNDGVLDTEEEFCSATDCTTMYDRRVIWNSLCSYCNSISGTYIGANSGLVNVTATTDKSFYLIRDAAFNSNATCPDGVAVVSKSAINYYTGATTGITAPYNVTYTFDKPVVNPSLVFSSNQGSVINFPTPVYLNSPGTGGGTAGSMITTLPACECDQSVIFPGIYTSISFSVPNIEQQMAIMLYLDDVVPNGTPTQVLSTLSSFCIDLDTDGDGIPNRLDLDSDGDGCPDAKEAGVSALAGISMNNAPAGMGVVTGTTNAVAPSPYGANGFSDFVEKTSAESGLYKGVYTYKPLALSKTLNACTDTDGDGIPDLTDLDDDNDGILDAVECPNCYYTAAEVSSIYATGTDLNWLINYPIIYATDGDITSHTQTNGPGQAITNKTVIEFSDSVGAFLPISSLNLNMTGYGLSNSASDGAMFLQGWDGLNWVNLSTNVTNATATTTVVFNNTLQPNGLFSKYRVRGFSGNAGWAYIGEASITLGNTFTSSAYPKPSCSTDTDGDGITNDKDLDSDGDGCPDAIEGGAGLAATTLVTSTMPGGNSGGTYTGTSSSPVVKNLCNATVCVGSTPTTMGVPTVVATGQAIGNSQNKLVQSANCPVCLAGTVAPAVTPTTASATCLSTVNLTTLASTGSTQVGATKIWSTHNPPTSVSDTLTTAQASAVAVSGKYYTFFYDNVNACYSPADSVIVTITPCPATPDYVVTPKPACLSCSVKACVVGNDIPAGAGTPTITTCGTPAGYTAAGPDASGCFTYTPTASVSLTTPATSCIVICKNGVCDTTYITIPVPVTPDTIVTPPAKCPTCPVGPVCVVGNNIPAGAGTPTITTCGTPAGYTAAGPDASGCFTYTPTASVSLTTPATSCIVICKNGVCDTTYITIPVPVTPDTVVTPPAKCPTCPVGPVCVVGDDIPAGAGTPTITTCGTPAGYTASGPDASGCFTYTPTATVSLTTPATSCIVICKNGVCDTTYITIPVPVTPDTIVTPPAKCPTCPVGPVCVVGNNIPAGAGTPTITTCGTPAGYTAAGPDASGCFTYTPTATVSLTTPATSCIVICKNGVCDTTYITIPVPVTPDTIVTPPAKCPTCPVGPVCVVGNNIPAGAGTPTITTCGTPAGYTAAGPDASGCFTYTPTASVSLTTPATSCIVICKNGVCDTTYITIPVPVTPDTVVTPPAKCPTCPVGPVCVVGDDIPAGAGTPTITTCGTPAGYTASGPDASGCFTYTPTASVSLTTPATSCIVICKNGVCDTTYITIPVPVTPDTVVTPPAKCPTCPVGPVCVVGDDIPAGAGTPTITTCGTPAGYTASGPDASGCFTYTPTATVSLTTPAKSCIVICKNGVCDTTYITIPVPITPDTVTVRPTCPTCPVKACVVADDITVNSTTTYSSCGLSPLQSTLGTLVLDLNGCLIFQGNGTQGALDTIKTCVVACNGTVCDTTYINIAPAAPPYGPDTINVTPACGTCTIAPICATGDDLPASIGTPTVTTCGLTPAQSVLGTLTLNSSGCAVWTPNGTKQTDTIKTCIIICVTPLIPGVPVCDTTKIWIAPPPTPDYDTITPACPTCPVKVCPVANDIHITSATTFSTCGAPSGYTITGGPSTAGCYTFTPLSPMPTTSVTTCVVACNGTVCDTTYVLINKPVTPDTIVTPPAKCPTCPVGPVCVVGDDIPAGAGTPTITTCGTPAGYTAAGPDASGCFTYTPTASVSLTTPATSCIVICKNGVCDTTYITIPVPVTPDTVVTPPAKCPTCPVGPVCVVGDDIAVHTGATYTTCGTPAGYTAAGPDASGCFTYTPTASVSLTTPASSCIVICKNGVCDTTYITIPVPVSPDTVVTPPAKCPTCPVGPVCVVGDDIAVHAGATYTTCGTPAGYTSVGPDASGCFTYTPTASVSLTTPATSCIVICKNGVCDTTYITIPIPVTPDSVITTPACPTCPVKVCTIGDDIANHTGATYSSCGAPIGYNQTGPDANGCYTYTPTSSISTTTVTTCQVICKNGVCDTTYVVINPPAPEKNNDVNITGTNTLVNGNVHTNDVVPAGTTYGPPTPNPSNPAGGQLNFSPDGSYTFIAPTPGVYKFIVPVCVPGQSLPCPTTELDITVLDPNTTTNPPVANTDLGTTKGTNPVTINSLANDLSGNLGGTLDPTSVVVTTPPAHGTYSVNPTTGAITYTPTAGFTGKDTLYYSVKDANGNTSIAMQVITVLPIDAGNTTTATDDYASAGKGQNATGNVKINDIDPEGNTTSVTPLDSTIAGVGRFVIDASGNYTFTPAPGYTGPISVPYTITDANGAKASATVHILISNLVAPLNVNWLGFNISNTHCLANLVWQVSSLAKTSYFEVQKSSNSANWKTIGKITDIDRTKLEAQFTYTDNELLTSANSYYRLKEIELNGNTNYSEVRYANCKEGYSINIYPNPVEDKLTISFTRESDLEPTIMIYNMAGQRVQTNLIKNTNNKELVFSLSHLASGVYTIIINDNDFGKSTYKVMKK